MSDQHDYTCPICGSEFDDDDDLDSESGTITCPSCGHEFSPDED